MAAHAPAQPPAELDPCPTPELVGWVLPMTQHANFQRRPNPLDQGDGDAQRFCSTCAFGRVCLTDGYDKRALEDLHCLVEHTAPLHAGDEVFHYGQPFSAIYAVRAGMVKTRRIDEQGREQILGFFLPGELIGLNGLYSARYPCDAVALDTVTLCRFAFPALGTLATRLPGIQETLFRLMSKDIVNAALLAGDYTADERLAAFLANLSDRFAERGYSPTRLYLMMSRADIANYLRLAPETVSRVLRRFQDEGLIAVDKREVTLTAPDRLQHLARCVLQT
jgi:CRP/FNR family transcriptional regulator